MDQTRCFLRMDFLLPERCPVMTVVGLCEVYLFNTKNHIITLQSTVLIQSI